MTATGKRKAILLLWAAPEISKQDFRERFILGARKQRTAADGLQRWSLLLERTWPPVVHEVVMKDSPPPCDGTVHIVEGDTETDLTAAAKRVLDYVTPFIASDKTKAVICTEVVIVPRYAPVFVMMANQRPDRITHEDHIEAWYGRHAKLGVAAGAARYRQNHVRIDETSRFTKALGLPMSNYDGIACSYFADLAEGLKRMSGNHMAETMIEDERNFIDHSRSNFGLYEDVVSDTQ